MLHLLAAFAFAQPSSDEMLGRLKTIGYSGWLVVEAEQDPKKAHPLTYGRMGFAHLSRLLADADLRM